MNNYAKPVVLYQDISGCKVTMYNAFVDDSDNAETFFSRIVRGGYAEDPKYLDKILRVYYSV